MNIGEKPVIEFYILVFNIHLAWFYIVFILFMLVASSNALNIIDWLDGLDGGLWFYNI